MKTASIFKEGQIKESVLILFDRNVSNFHDEVQQKERYLTNIRSQEQENISDLFGSDLDEVEVFQVIFLVSDKIFTISIVIFAE